MTALPDNAAAVEFLKAFHPRARWVLTAITPDRRSTATRTFGPGHEAVLTSWLASRNGRANIYFSVGEVGLDLCKKAEKSDIARVSYLHVDLDPRAGEPLAQEQARIRSLLTERLPASVPPPTTIVFTGGGYAAFWRLAEPIAIAGDPARVEEVERRNIQLALDLGGDHCHNVDRIMRLPGSVNLPDAKKARAGRVATTAQLIAHHPERVYTIDQFRAAPAPGAGATAGRTHDAPAQGGRETVVDLAPARLSDLSELDRCGVPDRVKVIINHGRHPDEPKLGDNSRSAWLFDAVCQLVRAGVPEELILGIITDPAWTISESVLEQGRRAVDYARRQIERAREEVAADAADFHVNKDGVPYPNQHNIRVALHRLGVRLSHDQFADRLLVEGLPGYGPALQDEAVAALYLTTDARFGFRPAKDFFWMVVEDEARRHGFHPLRQYLDSLQWDGTPRLDRWLVTYGGAEDTPYARAVGPLALIAAARRARQPGCKFDEMLVLESPQGQLKSSALRVLAVREEWFTDDLPLGADTKTIIERLHGRWIVEAAELKGMRRGDVEHLKAFLSRQQDRSRMAYGRITKEVPRQCVIIGTTNSDRYLRDGTGNRRFWPVRVGRFEIDRLRADRDQLWAEAAAREAAGESIRLDPSLYADAGAEQEARHVEDPFLGRLASVLGDLDGKLRAEAAWEIIGVTPGQRTQDHNARLGEAMRALGWERTKLRFGSGGPEWCYARGDHLERSRRIIVHRGQDGSVWADYEGAQRREAF